MENEFRNRHIGWVTNAGVTRVTRDPIPVEEVDEHGATIWSLDRPDKA